MAFILADLDESKDCFKINVPHKGPFYDLFWPFFRNMHVDLSQNLDSDSHFEVLNGSEF